MRAAILRNDLALRRFIFQILDARTLSTPQYQLIYINADADFIGMVNGIFSPRLEYDFILPRSYGLSFAGCDSISATSTRWLFLLYQHSHSPALARVGL